MKAALRIRATGLAAEAWPLGTASSWGSCANASDPARRPARPRGSGRAWPGHNRLADPLPSAPGPHSRCSRRGLPARAGLQPRIFPGAGTKIEGNHASDAKPCARTWVPRRPWGQGGAPPRIGWKPVERWNPAQPRGYPGLSAWGSPPHRSQVAGRLPPPYFPTAVPWMAVFLNSRTEPPESNVHGDTTALSAVLRGPARIHLPYTRSCAHAARTGHDSTRPVGRLWRR